MPRTAPVPTSAPTHANGLFITVEGADGAGKTTQCALLIDALKATGRQVVSLREPGGTRISESIRSLLLDPDALDPDARMNPVAELLLYEAARAQLVFQVIRPALQAGAVVVCDRFFDSTYAYQGFARGLGTDVVSDLNRLACGDVVPTRTLVLDLDPNDALARAVADGQADRMESEGASLQQKVRAGLLDVARREPNRVHVIDASGDVAQVFARIQTDLADLVDLVDHVADEKTIGATKPAGSSSVAGAADLAGSSPVAGGLTPAGSASAANSDAGTEATR